MTLTPTTIPTPELTRKPESTSITKVETIVERDERESLHIIGSWEARAWTDENRNGVWDSDEPPLADVKFWYEYPRENGNKSATLHPQATSDRSGVAILTYDAPWKAVVYAEAPQGFHPTTPERLEGAPFRFGFVSSPEPTVTALGSVCDDSGCNGDIWTRPTDEMVMVYVPGGTFQMGVTDDDPPFVVGGTGHTVTLSSFWIDQTEVTNAQYRECVEAGECSSPTACDQGEPTYGDVSFTGYPVVCVGWFDSQAYCEWAGARLPTEAEWEYAARGSQGFFYPWGNKFHCTRGNFSDRMHECDGYRGPAPAGSFETGASWCGALDLAGNVLEWVNDWFDHYPIMAQTNPTGPATGYSRVHRGGSWYDTETLTSSVHRGSADPDRRIGFHGFRCAVSSTTSP